MAERKTARDNQGRVFEWVGGQWVPQQEDPGALGAFAINAGERLTNIGAGIEDAALAAVEQPAPGMFAQRRKEIAAEQASNEGLLDQLQQDRPISSFAGQIAPNVIAAPLGGASIPGQMAIEGTIGASAYGTPLERLQRGALDAALAGTGSAIVNRVVRGTGQAGERIAARRAESELLEGAPGGEQVVPGSPDILNDSAGAMRAPGSVVGTGRVSPTREVLQNMGREMTGEGINSPADLEALITLRGEGFNLKPGQTTKNRAGRILQHSAERSGIFSDVSQEAIQGPNQSLYNRRVLEALGDEGNIRADVPEFKTGDVERIRADVGAARSELYERTPDMSVSSQRINGVQEIRDNFKSSVAVTSETDKVVKVIDNVLDEILGGSMKTQEMVTVRSHLRGLQRNAKLAHEQDAYAGVIEQLDEAYLEQLIRNGNVQDFEAFQTQNLRFRMLDALGKPGVVGPEGDVAHKAYQRNLAKIFKSEYGADLNDGLRSAGEGGEKVQRVFNITKALNRHGEVAGSSGTPEGLTLQGLFESPIATSSQLALRPLYRKLIQDQQRPVQEFEELRDLLLSQ